MRGRSSSSSSCFPTAPSAPGNPRCACPSPLPVPAEQHRERARHPFDRSQPLRPGCRADALHRRGSKRATRGSARTCARRSSARRRSRARTCRCLSTRPSGVRRCSSARSPTTRSSPPMLSDRSTALLYHGLAGLDDETLAWLGPERETLRHLLRHAGAFAVFGPSVRVRAGRVVVPGGAEAEPLWQAIVGAEPARPAAFVRRLFGDESGDLAWFYDALANLDEPRLRFATSASLPAPARIERVRALLDVFESNGNEWQAEKQPFSRRPFDPAISLGVIQSPSGWHARRPRTARPVGTRVCGRRGRRVPVAGARLVGPRSDAGRCRLAPDPHSTACRLMSAAGASTHSYSRNGCSRKSTPQIRCSPPRCVRMGPSRPPATLERAGVTSPGTISAAAARAHGVSEIGDDQSRTLALTFFQAAIGIIDRIVRSGSLSSAEADGLITRLAAVDHSARGYAARVATWIQKDLLADLPVMSDESSDALEDTLLAAMAGVRGTETRDRVVEWEGRRYRVNAARGEELRLHRVRERQGGASLQAALQSAQQNQETRRRARPGRHRDFDSLRRVSGSPGRPGARRRQRRAPARPGSRRNDGTALPVAAAVRGAHRQGLACVGLAPGTRRRARSPVVAASGLDGDATRTTDGVVGTPDRGADRRVAEPARVERCHTRRDRRRPGARPRATRGPHSRAKPTSTRSRATRA